MLVLRFFAGPIVHKLSPLGLLAASAVIAALGLTYLSTATGVSILIAATLYGFGKTFFWPTMLGVVSEQCPRGGALTLNAVGGVGMLAVGVLGTPFIGLLQANFVTEDMTQQHPALFSEVKTVKDSIFGQYEAVSPDRMKKLAEAAKTPEAREKVAEDQRIIASIEEKAKKRALGTMAIFPCIMLAAYLVLIVYFKSRGGYKAEVLTGHAAVDEKFTGGVPAAVE
jgi:MFS family permease